MSELPLSWVAVPLQEFGAWGSGGTPSKGSAAYYQGDIPWAVIGDLNDGLLTTTANQIADSGLANSSAKLVPPGTLLVAMYGSIGKLAITGIECCTNQAIAFCRVDDSVADRKYLFHALRWARPELIKLGQGASQQNISQTILKAFEVPLAPRPEQTRIAAKLDELLAQVDTLKARIDGIPALLKRFRQSVLAAAVSGRLTEEWRGEGTVMPRRQVGDFFEITSGPAFKKEQYSSEGSRLLQIANVGYGVTIWESVNYIPMDLAELESRFELREGDIVMALNRPITNGVLKVATVFGEDLPATLYQRVARFRSKMAGVIDSRYMFLCFRTDDFKKQVEGELQGSDQPYINTSSLRNLEVYFPPLDEQTEIVRRVEQLFAFADQLEAKVNEARTRIDRLTQSILAKAFRGELVPQDPSDEPVSVMLERIQAQRASAPKARRARKTA